MLELTRRMTLARTSFTRIAGCYVDRDGDFEGSFNTNFLKVPAPERTKKLKLAKEIPFSATNVNLKKYEFTQDMRKPGSMWQLLMAMNECGLKNDALMDTFYDLIMENTIRMNRMRYLSFMTDTTFRQRGLTGNGSGSQRKCLNI